METIPFYSFMNPLIIWTIVALQVFSVLLFLGLLKIKPFSQLVAPVGHRALAVSFIVTLAAMLGSLYYSEVAGFPACILCWYQRVFIYPQVVLFGVALWYGRKDVVFFTGALSAVGLGFALYNIVIQTFQAVSAFCDPSSATASCLEKYVNGLGYITIPVMAATTLVFLLLVGWAGVKTHDLSLTR
jgi:disulfide bond formation protein DsbB